jgi:type I restriction enzyme S subunit
MDNVMMEEKVLKLDKSNWVPTKLGDLATEISKRVDNPSESEYDRFVGLGNFVSGDIKIKTWKSTGSLASSAKAFEVGDILFARRNAYLRRASMVDFEGCCSGDAFVLRENHDKVVPGFLAFLLNSDALWDYANSNAAGTMSKRVKWRDLAEYQFLLPPKDQQAKLAELLWAMVEVIESENEVLEKLNNSFLTNRKYFIENGVNQTSQSKKIKFGEICSDWQTEKLNNVCRLISGNAFKSTSFKDSGNYQVLRIGNITKEGINLAKSGVFVTEITTKEVKYLIPKGAIVLSLTGTNGKRDYGFPSLMDSHNQYLLNQRLVMLIADESFLLFEFLFLISKMELFQAKFFLNATGTANQANVSIADVSEIEIPIPTLQEQKLIVDKMNQIRIAITNSKDQIKSSKALQKSLINQVF